MSSKIDVNIIIWGVLIALITIGIMLILGITSNNATEIAVKLIIAISIPLTSIVLLSILRRIIHK